MLFRSGREPEGLCSVVLLAVAALDCSAADIADQTSWKAAGVVGVQGTKRPFSANLIS